jgi:3-hydroxybutyryl-CoA dehydrogenase
MTIDNIKTIGVVGAGQMGGGIAHVSTLVSGRDVILTDISQDLADKGKALISKFLAKGVAKGKLDQATADAALARVQAHGSMDALAGADFIIEAATENEDLKLKIFGMLDQIAPEGAILASNTSSIPITRIASATGRPDQVIGMHFMNPVPIMKLIEIISAMQTSDETLATTVALGESMGKTCIGAKDYPGFIANRILMPYLNEAFFALFEGIGDAEGIDGVMKLGTNVPMGPLTLADFIGLDTVLAILEVLHEGLGDPKYRPCPLLRKYVEAGYLGRKVGRGVYEY